MARSIEVGSLRDKDGNVKNKYQKPSDIKRNSHSKNHSRDKAPKIKAEPQAEAHVELDLPILDYNYPELPSLAEIEEEFAAQLRSEYEQLAREINGKLMPANEVEETIALQMKGYDLASQDEQFELVNLLNSTAQSILTEEAAKGKQAELTAFFANPDKVAALKASNVDVVTEFQKLHGGLKIDGRAGKHTKAEIAALENGVTSELAQKIITNQILPFDNGLPSFAHAGGEHSSDLFPRKSLASEHAQETSVIAQNATTPEVAPNATPVADALLAAQGVGMRVKQLVSATGDEFSSTLANWAENIKEQQPAVVAKAEMDKQTKPAPIVAAYNAPAQLATKNPFDIEKAMAKAAIPAPAPKQVQQEPELTNAEKISEIFANFNGKNGDVAMVYQRSVKLSPTDKAAATLVQQSLNLLGYAEIDTNEFGHVAGGQTKQGVAKFQKNDKENGLNIDGIVGANTYAAIETKVLAAIGGDEAKAAEFLASAEKIVNTQLAELSEKAKGMPNTNPNPTEIALNQANPAKDRGVSPS